jgi:DNA mismatch repair protein MutL
MGIDDALEPAGNTLQFADTYLIYNRGRTVYLIDQHNLHERILYEEFRKRREKSGGLSQALLFPLQVRLTPSLAALVNEHLDELAALGFEIEEFSGGAAGEQSFVLRGVPGELGSSDPVRAFVDCLERAAQSEDITEPGGFRRAFDINLACKSAIKAGHPLTEEEAAFLIGHIADGTFHTCPHGRPAVIALDEEWFRRIFKRS